VNPNADIREAMKDTHSIALGRVVMHTRERLMAIEPREKGLLVHALRMRDEVVNLQKALESIPDMKPDRQMVEIAEKIIAQLEGPFDAEEFRDRYEESLRDLIRRKEKGEKPTITAPPAEPSNVIDLMAALKKSLGAKGTPPKRSSSKPATASPKPPKKRTR
jgi:DNA end-binding protein Ku